MPPKNPVASVSAKVLAVSKMLALAAVLDELELASPAHPPAKIPLAKEA